MKRTVLFFILVFPALLGIAAGGSTAGGEHHGPKIVVNGMRADIGKVPEGGQAAHVFEIWNEGDETLIIDRVQPG